MIKLQPNFSAGIWFTETTFYLIVSKKVKELGKLTESMRYQDVSSVKPDEMSRKIVKVPHASFT